MEITYYGGFDRLKNNYIFGVKFYFNKSTPYTITWEKKYAPLTVLFLETELSGSWGKPDKLNFFNKTFTELNEEVIIK